MTSIKAFSITAASLAAGLSLLSVSGNAAQANPYNTFGEAGGCDSFAMGGGMNVVVGLLEDAAAKITAIGHRTRLAATAAIPHSPNSSDSVVD